MIVTQPGPLQKKLADMRREAEERDAERRAQKSGYPYIDLRKTPSSLEAIRLVPEATAKDGAAVALELKAHEAAVAAVDPNAPGFKKVVDELAAEGYTAKVFTASRSGISHIWESYKLIPEAAKKITGKVDIAKADIEALAKRLTTFQAVREEMKKLDFGSEGTADLLELVLAGGLAIRASDIHFESEEKRVKIRFRLDGLLHDIFDNLPKKNFERLVSRIKLLSGLKINVRDQAQDGRFTIGFAGKEVEVRVSIIPAEFGETIVMRLLDPTSIQVSLADLGLRGDDLVLVKRELEKPNGLLLNTGPTGSGKTTTLYAFLRQVSDSETKIITIEDPIEYRIEGVEQTQVDTEAGYTFAGGLRSILRQDPDVILVGEIRDQDTADIALQAALTGHLVFSTLHTNDAVGAVPRLVDLGVRAVSIGPALNLVIAQRLVRKLCPDCKKAAEPSAELAAKIKNFLEKLPARVDRKPYEKISVYEPVGCNACNQFGYRGRIGIFEFFEGGPELEETILKEASEVALRALAKKQGMVTMQEDGVLKVLMSITSFDEVKSVTGELTW